MHTVSEELDAQVRFDSWSGWTTCHDNYCTCFETLTDSLLYKL